MLTGRVHCSSVLTLSVCGSNAEQLCAPANATPFLGFLAATPSGDAARMKARVVIDMNIFIVGCQNYEGCMRLRQTSPNRQALACLSKKALVRWSFCSCSSPIRKRAGSLKRGIFRYNSWRYLRKQYPCPLVSIEIPKVMSKRYPIEKPTL